MNTLTKETKLSGNTTLDRTGNNAKIWQQSPTTTGTESPETIPLAVFLSETLSDRLLRAQGVQRWGINE